MIELIKGEKDYASMQVKKARNVEEEFNISTVECKVLDNMGNEIESGMGDIEDSIVTYFLDTTFEYFLTGRDYVIVFEVTIVGSERVLMGKVVARII